MNDPSDRFLGCLVGLAVGDAVGTTVEFHPRGSFEPVTDLVGGGPFGLEPGQWTDDTSMALCLAASLVETGGFDPRDQMDRYLRWAGDNYMSSTGSFVDMGGTVGAALYRYLESGDPFSGALGPRTAGNGSLMRLAPVPMFFFPDLEAAEHHAVESSRTTHGAQECLQACRLLAGCLVRALKGQTKEEILGPDPRDDLQGRLRNIANGTYKEASRDTIRGTGYVVDCLEAALWCFHRTGSYRDAVLEAANLGDDADTTAAVCGQLAGAHYGVSGIPDAWRERLAHRKLIESLALGLMQGGGSSPREETE